MATCNGTSCGITCYASYHLCSGVCWWNSATTSCGLTSCSACTPPSDSTATCNGTSCGYTCATGSQDTGTACTPKPPRPIAPLSVSFTTTAKPTFKWALASGTDGAHIDICPTRACTTFDTQADLTGGATSWTSGTTLSTGVHFWRLYGRDGSTTGTIASPGLELVVSGNPASNSTAGGAVQDFNGHGYADIAGQSRGSKC